MLSYLWGGSKTTEKKEVEENADPELALREQMDAHGEFAQNLDGTLEYEHYKVMRAIIMRQACRAFAPKKKLI